jgi:uncharacterized protein YggU (UPF0235/DUF167 family)
LGVPKSAVTLVKGQKSRNKTVTIKDLTLEEAEKRLGSQAVRRM